jgi:hypothetical protein
MFIGAVNEFEDNLKRLEQAAELNKEQRIIFGALKDSIITDYRSHRFAKVFTN